MFYDKIFPLQELDAEVDQLTPRLFYVANEAARKDIGTVASVNVTHANPSSDIRIVAKKPGLEGNLIRVVMDPITAGLPLLFSRTGNTINIRLASINGFDRTTTAAQLVAALNSAPGINANSDSIQALVTFSLLGQFNVGNGVALQPTLTHELAGATASLYSPKARPFADRVIQADLPNTIWELTDLDVLTDASWLSSSLGGSAGTLPQSSITGLVTDLALKENIAINKVPQTSFINPTTLAIADFTRLIKHRPMSPMDESAIYFEEKFTTGNSGQWVGGLEVAPGFTMAGKYSTSVNGQIYQYAEARPVIPYTSAAIRIEDMGTTNATIWAVGFQAGSNPANGQGRVFATYNRISGITDILVRKADGTVIPTINPVTIPWTGPFELCLMLQGEGASVWTRKTDNDAWVFACTNEIPTLFDARELANLNALRPCFYSNNDNASVMTISRFRAGYVMGVGIANPSLVTYENGEPYIKDNRVYFLANATMPSHALNPATSIRASSACIWSLGISDLTFRCESRLNFSRGGKSFGDNSGCILFDRKTKEFILMVPDWGSMIEFTMKVFLYKTKTNILTGVHLLSGTQLTLPGYQVHQWDPTLRKDGEVWKLAYNTFNGVNPRDIRTATSTDLLTWTAVAVNITNSEGAKWLRFGGVWYIISATGDTTNYEVYNEALVLVATMSTPTDSARHSLGCHPQFVHVPKADKSQLMLITMDNFHFRERGYSWGNLDVYKVGAETNGWEWQLPSVLP